MAVWLQRNSPITKKYQVPLGFVRKVFNCIMNKKSWSFFFSFIDGNQKSIALFSLFLLEYLLHVAHEIDHLKIVKVWVKVTVLLTLHLAVLIFLIDNFIFVGFISIVLPVCCSGLFPLTPPQLFMEQFVASFPVNLLAWFLAVESPRKLHFVLLWVLPTLVTDWKRAWRSLRFTAVIVSTSS